MKTYRHGQVVGGPDAPHLGGYVEGGDPNTHYPALWEWLVETYEIRSVLDVGCGDGSTMRYVRTLGVPAVLGIDGIAQADEEIVEHDYTKGPWPVGRSWYLDPRHPGFDVVWCCEFVEHVEERYVPNFLASFRLGALVLMTHALPGQGGHHHVNCRTDGYWIDRVGETIGYRFDLALTDRLRALAAQEDLPADANYFARSGLAFVAPGEDDPTFP